MKTMALISLQTNEEYLNQVKSVLGPLGINQFFSAESLEDVDQISKEHPFSFLVIEGTPSEHIDWDYFLSVGNRHERLAAVTVHKNEGEPLLLIDEVGALTRAGILGHEYIDGYSELGIYFSRNEGSQHEESYYLPLGTSSKTAAKLPAALLLDRDGIVNVDIGYCADFSKHTLVKEAIDLIKLANERAIPVFVLTNQSGIARGHYSEQELQNLHHKMNEFLESQGAMVIDWLYCPYHQVDNDSPYKGISVCRKPGPGMVIQAYQRQPFSIERSLMIGDKPSDHLDQPLLESWHLQGNYDLTHCEGRVFSSWDDLLKAYQTRHK